MRKKRESRSSSPLPSYILQVFDDLGTDVARACREEISSSPQAYLDRTIDVSKYEDWKVFFCDYIAINLLSKYPYLDIGVDREKVALEKFLQSERTCKEANQRIASFDRAGHEHSAWVHKVFHLARLKIEGLLGEFSWDECYRYMGFGPGASVGVSRARGDAYYKYGLLRPTTTRENLDLAWACIKSIPRWETIVLENSESGSLDFSSFELVEGNKVTTVSKNAKTDRVIAIEPLMNMYVQKGIGGLIRKLLKRRGCNLDDQSRNQSLAKVGSLGRLATLDLSAASDSLALGVVEWFLPPDWVAAIKLCRSSKGVLPSGEVIRYQKVSSMGNGFTFELESLIFWALSSSVATFCGESYHDVSVYGDDIIVPVSCVEGLIEALSFAGFTVNEKKSFWSGPFRESCGKHYFLGHDVTPLYIKDRVEDQERKLWFCNSIRRLAHRLDGSSYGCAAELLGSYESCRLSLPRWLQKHRIPDGFGDGALVGDFDEVTPRRAKFQLDGWEFLHYVRSYKSKRVQGLPVLLKSLKGLEGLSVHRIRDGVVVDRIPDQRYRRILVKGFAPQWAGLGPWW